MGDNETQRLSVDSPGPCSLILFETDLSLDACSTVDDSALHGERLEKVLRASAYDLAYSVNQGRPA